MEQQVSPYDAFLIGPEDAHTACLLIHGFSGTPSEMRGLGDALAEQGIRVYGTTITGHSANLEELVTSGRKQWIASVAAGLEQLAEYQNVFVGGLSMGGVLALILAMRHPERIMGIIAMSTPTRFENSIQARLVPVARYFVKWFYPLALLNFNNPKIQAEVLKQAQQRDPSITTIDFTNQKIVEMIKKQVRLPVPAIAELFAMTNYERRHLNEVRCALCIIQSKRDQTVEPRCAEELYRLTTSSPAKSLHWLNESDHVITTGVEREEVYRIASAFIAATVSNAARTDQFDDAQRSSVDETSPDH